MAPLKNSLLHRYWIEFASAPPRGREGYMLSLPLARFCGVTAYTLDDARYLIREQLCLGRDLPPIREIIEDVDIAKLDSGHIQPNMGEPFWRGVWYPVIDTQGHQRLRYHEPEV